MELSEHEQGQEQSPGRGLQAWALWVLASAIGGAVGGGTFIVQFVGEGILFGAILGAAQALILRRYLDRSTAELWVYASFFGWFVGWLVFILLVRPVATELVPGLDRQAGSPIVIAGVHIAGTTLLRFVIWAVFAAFQGAVLAWYRRVTLPLAALWVVLGTLGGMLAVALGLLINVTGIFSSSSEGLFLGQIVPPVVMQAATGALYGAVTGLVLAMIARRSVGQEDSTR